MPGASHPVAGPTVPSQLPDYAADLIDESAEAELVRHLERLPLRELQFRGFTGRRRVASFGWQYDFTSGKVRPADDIPPFLLKLGARAADFGHLDAADLRQALVTEYSPGAAIGWHRDKREFGTVIGVSLGNACRASGCGEGAARGEKGRTSPWSPAPRTS